ncbi:hypothetical protein AAFN88_20495 [Pelagibius sp. CAU 1746]|uniref:hypothetical protein n=1 Tax=Pelagibius sp. CAU 1746 TaxID=3140370 RepID=UPI00325AB291
MRFPLIAALLVLVPGAALAANEIKWPDAAIPVPPLIQAFIVAECLDHAGTTGEDADTCVTREEFGYRAVVMMLTDAETAEKAAERYRSCRSGLGMQGGRFHRRRADCIGGTFLYKWRFQDTRRAAIPAPEPTVRSAAGITGATGSNITLGPHLEQSAQARHPSEASRLAP